MHEMTIALNVCRIAAERVGPENLSRVVEVGLEVGSNSGVEVDNLEFWLEVMLSEPPFVGARLVIARSDGDDLRVSYLEIEDGREAD